MMANAELAELKQVIEGIRRMSPEWQLRYPRSFVPPGELEMDGIQYRVPHASLEYTSQDGIHIVIESRHLSGSKTSWYACSISIDQESPTGPIAIFRQRFTEGSTERESWGLILSLVNEATDQVEARWEKESAARRAQAEAAKKAFLKG